MLRQNRDQLLNVFPWTTIFLAIGILSILLGGLSYLIVVNKPEDLGFKSPNNYPESTSRVEGRRWWKNLQTVLNTARVWPGFLVQFGMIGSLYGFMGLWGIRYLQDVHNLERGFAAFHMTIMLLAFAVGALIFGWLSDTIKRRKAVIVLCTCGYFLTWLLFLSCQWSAGLEGYLLFGLIGLMGSGFVVTFAAAKEVIHPSLSGMAVSVVNTGCFIGTALMQPLFGWIVDLTWQGSVRDSVRVYSAPDYHNGFLLVLLFAGLAVAGALRIHETGGRNITVEK